MRIPAPAVPDPRDVPALRWGVLGPGNIARSFATSLLRHTDQRLAAVGSRSGERSAAFAEEFGIPVACGSYEELAQRPDVDVVYVATPHSGHAEAAELCLRAGKHVLIEKPVVVDAAQARRIRAVAQETGLFAMEATWFRFLPWADSLRRLLAEGALGEIVHLQADLGEHFSREENARMFDPTLGGGAPLDLGVYLVNFCSMVLDAATGRSAGTEEDEQGAARGLEAVGVIGSRTREGVVQDAAFTLHGVGGTASAQLYTTLRTATPSVAFLQGTRARLAVAAPFYAPPALQLVSLDGSRTDVAHFGTATQEDGLCFEAAEVARRIAAGETGSPLMPLTESARVLEVLDAVEARVPSTSPVP